MWGAREFPAVERCRVCSLECGAARAGGGCPLLCRAAPTTVTAGQCTWPHRHTASRAGPLASHALGTWPGLVSSGLAWPDLAWSGLAWPGLVWLGLAWPGLAWTGLACLLAGWLAGWADQLAGLVGWLAWLGLAG